MLNRFLNSQTKTITFAALLLAASASLSRVLGLVRDRLLAGRFGAGAELDIYFAAFRIPDFVYGIFIVGGLAAVFLPVFSEYFKKGGEEAWEFTNNLLNCFFVLLVLACGFLALFSPLIINFAAPGFSPESKNLAVSLARIMFLSPILFGIASIFSGILHYFNRFLIYSTAPLFYNLGIIFGILFFVPLFGLRGLAFGVILGAFLYFLIQIPAAKISGYKYLFRFNFKERGIMKVFKLMIPRTIGAAAYQINLIVVTAIASILAVGSIAVFNFANNLQYFPIGLIGVSFALAAFPVLSRNWAEGEKEKFSEIFSSTFRMIVFLIIPSSALIFILKSQIVGVVFKTGQFNIEDVRLTAASLGAFSFGIFAASLIPFLARVFYSFQDTKTPLFAGLVSLALNVSLSFLFVFLLGFPNFFREFSANIFSLQGVENISVVGLPLALSLSGTLQFFLLFAFLGKKIGGSKLKEIRNSFGKAALSGVLSAAAAFFLLRISADFLAESGFAGQFFRLSAAAAGGVIVYLALAAVLKCPELKIIKSSLLKQFSKI